GFPRVGARQGPATAANSKGRRIAKPLLMMEHLGEISPRWPGMSSVDDVAQIQAKWPEAYLRNPGDEPAGLCSRPARRPQAGVSRRRTRRATVALPLLWPASELRGFLQQRLERLQRCHLFLVLLPLLQLLLTVLQRLRPHRIACAYSVHVSSPVGSSLPAG